MKKKWITALVLFLAVALLLPACSDSETQETTVSPTTTLSPDTQRAPESDSDTAPGTEDIKPPIADEFLVLRDSGAQDYLVGDGSDASLAARNDLLVNDYGIKITEKNDSDIVKTVSGAILSGRSDDYGALILTSENAVELFCEGHLQDLSEAGIDADESLPAEDISRNLAFGDGIYMLCSDALSSKYSSACGVLYRADVLDAELAKLVLDGKFTLEAAMMLAENASSSISASVDAKGATLVYQGMGGKLFGKATGGLPTVALSGKDDALAYAQMLGNMTSLTAEGGIFTVTRLAKAQKGEIYLPMPKATSEQKNYITPVDTDALSVLAVPYGITDGATVKRAIAALCAVSANVPAEMAKALAPAEGDSRLIAEKIVGSLAVEQSLLYGWGDLSEYLFENLVWRVDFDTILADKTLADRREAVDTAASIINGRIKNRRKK